MLKKRNIKSSVKSSVLKAVWKDYFDQLLNEEFDWCREGLEKTDEVCGPSERITVSEVREALGKSKSGKAAGPIWGVSRDVESYWGCGFTVAD